MKGKIFLTCFLLLFCVSFVSADFLFDNVKRYEKATETITIKNAFGLPFIGDDLAKYKLTSNTNQCLINCEAQGTATLYIDGYLFTDMRFKDNKNDWTSIKSSKIFIKDKGSWVEYKNQILSPGTYEWKITGKKNPQENIDWIASAFGEDLTAWAWWNGNWLQRKQFNVTGGNSLLQSFEIAVNITKETGMQDDFDDIRFVNGSCEATQDSQLFHDKTNYTANSALFWTNVTLSDTGNNMFCMYYNNIDATDGSDPTQTYDFLAVWHFDDTNSSSALLDAKGINNCTLGAGATTIVPSGRLGNAFSFNGNTFYNCTAGLQFDSNESTFLTVTNTTLGTNNIIFSDNDVTWNHGAGGGTKIEAGHTNAVGGQVLIPSSTNINSSIYQTWSMTYNGSIASSTISLWLNGTHDNSGAQTGLIRDTGDSFIIGGNNPGVNGYDGEMDELWVDNKTRTTDYISRWHQNLDFSLISFGAEIDSQSLGSLNITLNSPLNDVNSILTDIYFSSNFSIQKSLSGASNLTNATLYVWLSNMTLFKTNSTTITGQTNFSNLSISEFNPSINLEWNYFACMANSTTFVCNMSSSNRTINIQSIIDSEGTTLNVSETSSQTFEVNITSIASVTPSGANLYYQGTPETATVTSIAGDQYRIHVDDKQMETVSAPTNRTFLFSWNLGSFNQNSTPANQTINPINLTICDININNTFINITFKNETVLQEDIGATATASFIYWLGDGSVNETLTFANTTENNAYALCFNPPGEILKTAYTLNYNNAESQQRTSSVTSVLSSVVTNVVLYLLPTNSGLFSTFTTIDNLGNTLATVKSVMTRVIGGSTVTVNTAFTDDSGFLSVFLNPENTYTATFSKIGFDDFTFSFVPSTDLRTIILGGGSQGIPALGNGTTIALNTSYVILPSNQSLNNNTDYTFSFALTTSQPVTLMTMNITNNTGGQLTFQSNAGATTISDVINTGNLTRIIGKFHYQTDVEDITVTRVWTVGTEFVGDYSLYRQLTLYLDYEFKPFMRILLILAIIGGVIVFMSGKEFEVDNESKVIVIILLMWAFSFVGWLDTGIVSTSTSSRIQELSQFSSQYGIAILSTAAGSFFILRRLFIRRI